MQHVKISALPFLEMHVLIATCSNMIRIHYKIFYFMFKRFVKFILICKILIKNIRISAFTSTLDAALDFETNFKK